MSRKSNEDWDLFYLRVAAAYSTGSKDPSTQVAALLVDSERRLCSAGFNGFEQGADDSPERYEDREEKIKWIKHAEVACLDFFPHRWCDYTLYVYPFAPCRHCAEYILEDGRVKRVVSTDYVPDRWKENLDVAKTRLELKNVEVVSYPLPKVTT